jgi:glycosyltransferase involved in cell wall biosynthesis
MTGFLPMTEAWGYVRAAEVCVSPFYPTFVLNSTSPTKLIEYMAMGKAVVANDHPEQKQVLRDSAGGLCVPYREKAFADAIVELIRNPQKAAEMGQNGRKYVEQHRTYHTIAGMVDHHFRQISCGRTD